MGRREEAESGERGRRRRIKSEMGEDTKKEREEKGRGEEKDGRLQTPKKDILRKFSINNLYYKNNDDDK